MTKTISLFLGLILVFANNAFAQFSFEEQASIILNGGNSESKTYSLSSKNKHTMDKNVLSLDGSYNNGSSAGIRSVENWNITAKYERIFTEMLGGFISQGVEADRYKGVKRRYNTDLGAKYTFFKSEKNVSLIEAGYRYTIQKSILASLEDQKDHKARVFAQTEHKFSKAVSAKLWAEYIPNFSESEDYLINIEPSVSVALSSIFSLKMAYTWKYDNLPTPGAGTSDYVSTTSIIAKF